MLFNSYEFLLFFLPIVLIGYYLMPKRQWRIPFLLLASFYFYGHWNYKFLPLLLFSTFIDFWVGRKLEETENPKKEKRLLLLSLFINLGVLGFFKYSNFFIDNINVLLTALGQSPWENLPDIVLPVGISFYTFQSMSYTIDLYRSHSKAYKKILPFATYVAFFPQLIAGPIIRHTDLVDQLEEKAKRGFSVDFFKRGVVFFIIGLSKKILIADNIAKAIDPIIGMMDIATTTEAWMCALGYTLQLYFDFSGYSDMAIGLGLMFGLQFPQNFNSPYKSQSITEFWRRWHITLSTWLRDYLYISLGGNRRGQKRTYINLLLTMLLGGLWHGAAWTYVIWGGIHGGFLALERWLKLDKKMESKPARLLRGISTFFIVVIAWVVFRSESVELMTTWLSKMFIPQGEIGYPHFVARHRDRFAAAWIIGMYIVLFKRNTTEIDEHYKEKAQPGWHAVGLALMLFFCLLYLGSESPFLYFQF